MTNTEEALAAWNEVGAFTRLDPVRQDASRQRMNECFLRVRAFIKERGGESTTWIPVGERLPEALRQVLVACPDGVITAYSLTHPRGGWAWGDGSGDALNEVTHWMPFPRPPASESPMKVAPSDPQAPH